MDAEQRNEEEKKKPTAHRTAALPTRRGPTTTQKRWTIYLLILTIACSLSLFLSLPSIPQRQRRRHHDLLPSFPELGRHCASIPPPSASSYAQRQHQLSQALHSIDAAAYIAEPGANARYYANLSTTTWRLSERPFLLVFTPEPNQVILLTPSFELARAKAFSVPGVMGAGVEYVVWREDEDPYTQLAHRLASVMTKPQQRIVLDEQMRLFVADGLRRAGLKDIGSEVDSDRGEAAREVIAGIRERKSREEIAIMRCVNEVTLLAIRAVRPYMYVGMRESEAQALMRKALADANLASEGIFTTTQFGENAALPHGGGSDRSLGENDFVTFDVGGSLHGYWSDVTRTFALPESYVSPRHIEIWQVVKDAQQAALDEAVEGTMASRVDRAGRDVVERAGYGNGFTHRLGHGIGLEIHETPYLRGGYERRLRRGNTFSDEPGVYIEGDVGVRLEDCFVIDEDSGQGVLLTAGVGGFARSPWVP